MAKLGIMLTSGVESEDARTVRKITESALRLGHEVSLFLMDDGIYNLSSLQDLTKQGVQLTVCGHNAYEREVEKITGVLFGSQHDWAMTVHNSDRVIVFG